LTVKTSKEQLNLLLEANIGYKHAKQQMRTIKNSTPKRRLKRADKGKGSVLRTQTQETLKAIRRFGLHHTRLCA
jgi:hypothetical protein